MAPPKRPLTPPATSLQPKRFKDAEAEAMIYQADAIVPRRPRPFPNYKGPIDKNPFPGVEPISTEIPPRRSLPFVRTHKRGEAALEKRFETAFTKITSSLATIRLGNQKVSSALEVDGVHGHSPEYVERMEEMADEFFKAATFASLSSEQIAKFINQGDRFDSTGIFRRLGAENPPRRVAQKVVSDSLALDEPRPDKITSHNTLEPQYGSRVSPIRDFESQLDDSSNHLKHVKTRKNRASKTAPLLPATTAGSIMKDITPLNSHENRQKPTATSAARVHAAAPSRRSATCPTLPDTIENLEGEAIDDDRGRSTAGQKEVDGSLETSSGISNDADTHAPDRSLFLNEGSSITTDHPAHQPRLVSESLVASAVHSSGDESTDDEL